jgi:hypothetical protein
VSATAIRQEIIAALLGRLLAPMTPPDTTTRECVFNPALARALALDPAASALVPDMTAPIAVDAAGPDLFRLTERGTLLVSPALLAKPRLAGVVTRWAQETAFLSGAAGADSACRGSAYTAAAIHGAALIARLPESDRAELRHWLPDRLWRGDRLEAGRETAQWLAVRFRDSAASAGPESEPCELALPMEALLEAGGDDRIVSAPQTGMNRYGATSRPRPEAVHFSSSTASSVSDYGFGALDRLRRSLLIEMQFRGLSPEAAIRGLADTIGRELLATHDLDPEEADVVIAPSGTDAELLAVLIALGAGEKLANILIAPEETGRSVKVAAAGLAFHDGGAFAKGAPLWPDADIAVASVSVRDARAAPRARADVENAVKAALDEGLSAGRRALLHVVLGSKTGVSAPSPDFVSAIGAPGERVDVVADSCQGRIAGPTLGAHVRAGWMVQISGSKFFTGPPFSGALLIPGRLRARRATVARRLAQAPALAPPSFWSAPWRDAFADIPRATASFGPLLRWTGALIEAALFREASLQSATRAFETFCAALRKRLADCRYLIELDPPHVGDDNPGARDFQRFAGSSIICFAPFASDGDGARRRLDAAESELLFRYLNADLTGKLGPLEPLEQALAAQPFHIGQPVDLTPGAAAPNVILRLVIGARFFSTIAMAGERADAALDAEIADAIRALDKAELILSRWAAVRGA